MLSTGTLRFLPKAAPNLRVIQSASIFSGWLNSVFNQVDPARIKEVGPDRACAEWLIRCGASVKWKNTEKWHSDYNSLPPISSGGKYRIEEVDATDSAIMHIGFRHFEGLQHLRKIILHKAMYLENPALYQLSYVENILEELQVSSCGNITDYGIKGLHSLKNLKKLKLYDLQGINNKQKCEEELRKALPNTEINFPYAHESEIQDKKKE